MKAFVVALSGLVLEDLREAGAQPSERLRWLMQIGCYGKLSGDVQPAAAAALEIGSELTRAGMFVQTADLPPAPADARETALGELLGSLDDDTAVLLVLEAGYILTAPHGPVGGEMASASLADLAATLLELGKIAAPDWLRGKSFWSGAAASGADPADYSLDEEETVRKRLEGLGYI